MNRLLRSLLFVPGTRPERFTNAVNAGADGVVIDLEDSVDASRKAEARAAVVEFLADPLASFDAGPAVFVRVNASGSEWHADDLAAVSALTSIGGIVLPKAESPVDVAVAAESVASGVVVPLIETARGVLNAAEIATASEAIPALLFGAEDLTAQLGIPRTIDGDELVYARSQVVLAAAAAGADAIDAVFIDIGDLDSLRRDASRARAMGFRGKMAIHPSQIPVIHEVFTPSEDERERAQRIVDAFDNAQAEGEAVIRLDDRMVDMPVVMRAKRVLGLR